VSKIDELISELCPNGVRVAILDELCEVANNKRKPVKSSLRVSGSTPYYGANNIQDYVEGFTHDGEYVLIAEDGTASLSNYSVQYVTGKFWANNHVHVINGKDGVDNRFLFHFFGTLNFAPYLSGGTRAKLNKSKLLEIKIPIPPLEVQKEIVNILDKFTQLEAELSAELSARQMQYEYYRNQLLTFDGTVRVKRLTLGDIGKIVTGRTPKSSEQDYWGYDTQFITPSDIKTGSKYIATTRRQLSDKGVGAMKSNLIPAKSILVTCIGSDMGKTVVNVSKCITNQQINSIILNNGISPDYMYHLLASKNSYLKALGAANGSTMPIINKSAFSKIEIDIPPFDVQIEIAKLLDKFDILVNDISEGLPAEINARHQQYEYYRTKLLAFQELPA
jgi:type I restriction enzyme S subunit